MIIAIDGPAGSGKSTVARSVARRLGYLYVDTGAIYRALTLQALMERLDLHDEKKLIELSARAKIDLLEDASGGLKVMLDGCEVTDKIRDPELTNAISYVARIPGVRKNMVGLQRQIALRGSGAVLEGRDIGTVVFPDADRKFYLDADFEERVRRRHKELEDSGVKIAKGLLRADLKRRDQADMTRDVAPLKVASDAVYIDTTHMGIEEVVDTLMRMIGSRRL